MAKSYLDYLATGQINAEDAGRCVIARKNGREAAATMIRDEARHGGAGDAMAFGMLDTVAVQMAAWYGPKAAGEILDHYAGICRARATQGQGRQR